MAMGTLGHLLRNLRRAAPVPAGGVPDERLLERFAGGLDAGAFEELVRRHGPMVFGVCRRVLRHEQDAEDAFQATFLVLARRAASLRERAAVGNWLYGVAHRTALAARRASARRRARESTAVPCIAAPSAERDLAAALDGELARLPDKYRAVLVLLGLEGKTRRQAADELGVPEGTVASRLARARDMLAHRLARKGWALSGGVLAAAFEPLSACVPSPLVGSTIEAVRSFTAVPMVGPVPVRVDALAREVFKLMRWSPLKRLAVVGLTLVLLGSGLSRLLVAGQEIGPTVPAPPTARDEGGKTGTADKLQETLLGLEKKGWDALKRQNWDALKSTMSADFVAITKDGGRMDRAETLKALTEFKLKGYSLEDVKLTRLTDDAAVLTYKARVEFTFPGGKGKESTWVSSGWARRSGKWLNVFYQETASAK